MKYPNIIPLLLSFILFVKANSQSNYVKKGKLPEGKFVSILDSLDIIIIKGDSTFDYYGGEFLGSEKYHFSSTNCESSYKPAFKKATFLRWGPGLLCFEVDGIESDYIELIYTLNGRTLTYHKVPSK